MLCRKKTYTLDLRSLSPSSLPVEFFAIKVLAPWRSLTAVSPHSSHNLVPSDFDDLFKPAWLRRNIDRLQNVRIACPPLKMVFNCSVYRKRSSLCYYCSIQTETSPQSNTRHAPRKGRRVDDLENRQDRIPEFTLILFPRLSSSRNCCTSRIELMSSN